MRESVRAIIVKDDSLLVMKRVKYGDVYYTLLGGGIDMGETPEQALVREIAEEASLAVKPDSIKLVFMHTLEPFGKQYIFTCEVEPGEPMLASDSEEAELSKQGDNIFEPMWLPVADIERVPFRSPQLARALTECFRSGFPEQPKDV